MITIKTPKEISYMRESGKITAAILHNVRSSARPGVSTYDLNQIAEKLIERYKVTSSFKGYHGFPGVICTSVNSEIVHAPPSKKRILKEGDILTLDFGVVYKGYHSDSATTFGIGRIPKKAQKLIDVTREALHIGIQKAQRGNTLGDIGAAIQTYVEFHGYEVVRELAGHGIGKKLHEDPFVFNYGVAGEGDKLREGMVIAIEPMVTVGGREIVLTRDGFTFRTKNGLLSAHFEDTVAITSEGPKVLTK